MAAFTSTPTEAGEGPSLLGIAASIGAKIRDAAEQAKEEREKAKEAGEEPKKGSLFKSSLANQFNPIKSKKAKSNWAKQFSWNKPKDKPVTAPTQTDGKEGSAKLKEFIAGGFTAILKDTGVMVAKLGGIDDGISQNLAASNRSASTLTVIKETLDAQTDLRRKTLEEAKYARAEKKLEQTQDTSSAKSPIESDGGKDGGEDGGGGGGPLEWLMNALGIADIVSSIPGAGKFLQKLNPFKSKGPPVTQGKGGQPIKPRLGGGPKITTSGGAPAPKPTGGLGGMRGLLNPKNIFNGVKGFGIGLALDWGVQQIGDAAGEAMTNKVAGDINALPTEKREKAVEKLQAELAKEREWQSGAGGVFDKVITLGGLLGESSSESKAGGIEKLLGKIKLSEGGMVPSAVPLARGGVVDNPTKTMLNPGDSVIPLNRNVGKKMLGDANQATPGETAVDTVGAMILGVSSGMLGKTESGTAGDAVKQDIRKAAKEFGISNLTFTSSIGKGTFGAVDTNKDAKDFLLGIFKNIKIFGNGGKDGNKTKPPGDPGGDPTGPISAAPKGNETDIQSLQGSAGSPIDLSQNTDVATGTGLHHGNEDMRGGLRVRDYFIGGRNGPSDGSDGLGAKLYTPLGFGPLVYKSRGPYGIDFLDPTTKEKVGTYLHVNDAQHQQYDGKTVQPGTVVGTQGGLPGTPSALGSSNSVHLHVEGTDAFHRAVIRTYADGNIMKQQVGQSDNGNVASAQQTTPIVTQVAQSGMVGKLAQDGMVGKKQPAWWDIGGRINSWLDNSRENATIGGNKFGGDRYKQQMKELGMQYQSGGVSYADKGATMRANAARLKAQRAAAQRSRLGVQKIDGKWVNMGVSDRAVGSNPWWQVFNKKGATAERKAKQEALAKSLAARLNKEEGYKPPKPAAPKAPAASVQRVAPSSSNTNSTASATIISPEVQSNKSSTFAINDAGGIVPQGRSMASTFADFLYTDLIE